MTSADETGLLTLDIGAVAHGGHWVARAPDGRVVFVRHTLPGERVLAEITEERPGYLRADAVQVLVPASDRVPAPCPWAGRCGGCDFQHVTPAAQRDLKTAVVLEQLRRLAKLSEDEIEQLGVRVAALPGGMLGWRRRVRYTVDARGRAGLLGYRSHEVVAIDRCRIAHPAVAELPITGRPWPRDDRVEAIASSDGEVTVLGSSSGLLSGPDEVRQDALGRRWTLPAGSFGEVAFWQAHPAAPEALAQAVVELLAPEPTEYAWDLYGGAGLFAAALAPRVARVSLVESDRSAIAAARASLADLTNIHIVRSTVERFRHREQPDLVVLDPPRSGAGAVVVRRIVAARPRAVAYVACDPAAFARDVATFRQAGWRLTALRGFDAFPMTHHVELVGLLLPGRRV